ncbi:MAG: hypothetical protein WDN02_01980 [Methylovirgula sp.]|uniref:hypothetical protein n=1 Tax=Methylovirgula sp. TaxID=1978224 RepID=UPI0030760F31
MRKNTVRASSIALPNANLEEPAFTLTDAGRAYLLLEDIAAASVDLTPDIAAELASFTGRRADV